MYIPYTYMSACARVCTCEYLYVCACMFITCTFIYNLSNMDNRFQEKYESGIKKGQI